MSKLVVVSMPHNIPPPDASADVRTHVAFVCISIRRFLASEYARPLRLLAKRDLKLFYSELCSIYPEVYGVEEERAFIHDDPEQYGARIYVRCGTYEGLVTFWDGDVDCGDEVVLCDSEYLVLPAEVGVKR